MYNTWQKEVSNPTPFGLQLSMTPEFQHQQPQEYFNQGGDQEKIQLHMCVLPAPTGEILER